MDVMRQAGGNRLDDIEERFDVEATASPSGVTHLVFTHRPRR